MTRHPARGPARPVPDAAAAESRDDGNGSADERPGAGPASVRWHGALGRPLEPFLGVAERASRFVLPGSSSFGKAMVGLGACAAGNFREQIPHWSL